MFGFEAFEQREQGGGVEEEVEEVAVQERVGVEAVDWFFFGACQCGLGVVLVEGEDARVFMLISCGINAPQSSKPGDMSCAM